MQAVISSLYKSSISNGKCTCTHVLTTFFISLIISLSNLTLLHLLISSHRHTPVCIIKRSHLILKLSLLLLILAYREAVLINNLIVSRFQGDTFCINTIHSAADFYQSDCAYRLVFLGSPCMGGTSTSSVANALSQVVLPPQHVLQLSYRCKIICEVGSLKVSSIFS